MKQIPLGLALAAVLLLAGCGGGGDASVTVPGEDGELPAHQNPPLTPLPKPQPQPEPQPQPGLPADEEKPGNCDKHPRAVGCPEHPGQGHDQGKQ